MGLIDLIPFDRFVTRQELVAATGLPDRQVRRMIANLRETSPETLIISSSSGKGYKRPVTEAELRLYRRECIARLKAEARKVKAIDKAIAYIKKVEEVK